MSNFFYELPYSYLVSVADIVAWLEEERCALEKVFPEQPAESKYNMELCERLINFIRGPKDRTE